MSASKQSEAYSGKLLTGRVKAFWGFNIFLVTGNFLGGGG